jgi:hemolysin activation/secretion protein
MSYEPGSGECRVLISSKEQLETMLLNLGKLEGTIEILRQLRDVHAQLELLHDQRRSESN